MFYKGHHNFLPRLVPYYFRILPKSVLYFVPYFCGNYGTNKPNFTALALCTIDYYRLAYYPLPQRTSIVPCIVNHSQTLTLMFSKILPTVPYRLSLINHTESI